MRNSNKEQAVKGNSTYLLTVFNLATVFFVAFLVSINYHMVIFERDMTMLSFVIIAIYFATTALVQFGYLTDKKKVFDIGTLLPLIGLVGTLIGAIHIFSVFGSTDFASVDDLKKVIPGFTHGIYSALYPSLIGTLGLALLRIQMLILGKTEA